MKHCFQVHKRREEHKGYGCSEARNETTTCGQAVANRESNETEAEVCTQRKGAVAKAISKNDRKREVTCR